MKDTGGPAFPSTHPHGREEGMTLRDYFAGMAMQSLILAAKHGKDVDMLSAGAYQLADDMLKERSKE